MPRRGREDTEEPEAIRTSLVEHPLVVLSVIAIAGSLSPIAHGPALAVALGWLLLCGRTTLRGSPPSSLLSRRSCARSAGVALLFIVCGSRSTLALEEFQARYETARAQLPGPSRCAGFATVVQSPVVRTRSVRNAPAEAVTLWTGLAQSLDCEGQLVQGPLRLRLYGGATDLSRGDHVEIVAKLAPVRLFRNAALPNPWPGAARRGSLLSGSALLAERVSRGQTITSKIDRLRARVRARILATYSPLVAPLGRALVLGENDLGDSDAEAFRDSGLLHLLAVSGTHLVIAVFALVQGLRALLVRIGPLARRYDCSRLSSLMGAFLSIAYADFSGGSGSAWRAAFMLCVVCGARSLGLRVRGPAALGSSLLIGLAIDPLAGSDFSFLLSALATAGLIGIGQPLSKWCQRGWLNNKALRPVLLSFVATVSSTLPCAPVLAMMDGNMTAAALFANVVAGPLGELIALPACLLHGIVAPFPLIERGLALLGSGALYGVREVALWSASLEEAQFPVPFPSAWNLALTISSVLSAHALLPQLLMAGRAVTNKRLALVALLLFAVPTACSGSHASTLAKKNTPGHFAVTALDVGQGDALFLDFPDGTVGLIDGGGFATGIPDTGERVLLPYLRARKITRLDLVVLSHPHPDHMNGLFALAAQIDVGELWIPGAGVARKGRLAELIALARKKGARVRDSDELCPLSKHQEVSHQLRGISLGGLRAEVIAPCSVLSPPLGANDASLVLRLSYGKRSVLFTGDIEKRGEATLLSGDLSLLKADLLKVAHHGSDTSSAPAFVDAVRPAYAFISSGVRNRFKHPRPSTLRVLQIDATGKDRDIEVLRTDLLGSLTWSTDGERQWVRSFSGSSPSGAASR